MARSGTPISLLDVKEISTSNHKAQYVSKEKDRQCGSILNGGNPKPSFNQSYTTSAFLRAHKCTRQRGIPLLWQFTLGSIHSKPQSELSNPSVSESRALKRTNSCAGNSRRETCPCYLILYPALGLDGSNRTHQAATMIHCRPSRRSLAVSFVLRRVKKQAIDEKVRRK